MNKYKKLPPCPTCGEHFENVFEATDHLLEDYEEPFDPKLILPNGYSLMVGSLLRCLYSYSEEPERIKEIVQDTYATLYAAEYGPEMMGAIIEDIIVDEHMHDLDEEIKKLFDEESNEGGE